MADEEFDYMSDTFLVNCTKNDVRPGLIKGHSNKRSHELLKKKADEKKELKNKPKHVIESEQREAGLNSAISATNKGFSMLQKMGFTAGMGLGKNNTGIVEPIPIALKTDRQGLGRAEVLKQIKLKKSQLRSKHREKTLSVEDYRAHLSKKSKEREIAVDLHKSQKACQHLDLKNDISSPAEEWFWFDYQPVESDETVDVDGAITVDQTESTESDTKTVDTADYEFSDSEKLEMLTTYLRQTYFYCIWCGVQYEDEGDLRDCPGCTRDEH